MTIQFQCPACSQPIEIDPEWGGQAVVCPYCRKAVTAPSASTYFPAAQAPIARPAPHTAAFEAVSEVPAVPQYFPQPAERNLAAVWALVLSLSALACLITGNIIMAMHWDEIEPLVKLNQEGKSYGEINRAFLERFNGLPPAWLMAVALVMFLAFGLWVAGLVCAIIGVRRPTRRKLAIAALAISCLVALPVIFQR
ncbi:MAG: hypothetical protein V2A79_01395 [Planctomycetota bacterium]